MRQIWKYPLKPGYEESKQVVEVPVGARFLSVVAQDDIPTLYFLVVNQIKARVKKTIYVVGTGETLDEDISVNEYRGTVMTYDGALVWHIFMGEADA